MLWIKTLHIVLVASWFAGLFYLPRIFVNLAMVEPDSMAERARLLLMARKLLRFMNVLVGPALVLGLILWLYYGIGMGPGNPWMHAKLLFVVMALGYHHLCGRILRQIETGTHTRSHLWYRGFNEWPVLIMLITVALVVVQEMSARMGVMTGKGLADHGSMVAAVLLAAKLANAPHR